MAKLWKNLELHRQISYPFEKNVIVVNGEKLKNNLAISG